MFVGSSCLDVDEVMRWFALDLLIGVGLFVWVFGSRYGGIIQLTEENTPACIYCVVFNL